MRRDAPPAAGVQHGRALLGADHAAYVEDAETEATGSLGEGEQFAAAGGGGLSLAGAVAAVSPIWRVFGAAGYRRPKNCL